MKTIANILLVTIYAISSFGFGIKQFYCCGKLKSTTISYVQQQASKEKCGMGKCKSRCCRHTFSFYKLDQKHIAAAVLNTPLNQSSELHTVFPVASAASIVHYQRPVTNKSHAPPLHNGLPAYVFNCVFRI